MSATLWLSPKQIGIGHCLVLNRRPISRQWCFSWIHIIISTDNDVNIFIAVGVCLSLSNNTVNRINVFFFQKNFRKGGNNTRNNCINCGGKPDRYLDPEIVARIFLRGCHTVYPKKYAHGFVVLCFVVVMQSFIMNSHEVFIHIHQGCFAGTGAIVRLPQYQWSKPDGYGKISQCINTTKHSKAKTVCIFLGIYCIIRS